MSARHKPRILKHLLALKPEDRYLRFGYPATDEQIARYVTGLNFERDEIFGVFNRRLELVAMAHLAFSIDRIVVDRGQVAGIVQGSAVIDVGGVVGQVTRVYPLVSEVTLLTDRGQSIPVMNARTGSRHVAVGNPTIPGGALELKFVPSGTDVKQGDLLTTSGIDGVYPPGLHVGQVSQIDRRVDSSFARVHATPAAKPRGRHLLVLMPVKDWPTVPAAAPEPKRSGKGRPSSAAPSGVKP